MSDALETRIGMQGILPRFPQRQSLIAVGGEKVFNNITVQHSQIGVLNTGTIGAIDTAIGHSRAQGEADLATAIQNLTQGLVNDAAMEKAARDEALELVSAIANEASRPKGDRRKPVLRALLVDLSGIMSGIASTAQLWATYGPTIQLLLEAAPK